MTRFNTKTYSGPDTVNMEGTPAYQKDSKTEFIGILLTSFLSDQFYKNGSAQLNTLISLMDKIPDKLFLAKAAIYSRNVFGMRSTSHVVAGELMGAKRSPQFPWMKDFLTRVVYRPDDILEILGYYAQRYQNGTLKKLPHAAQKAFAAKLRTYSEYQLVKYLNKGKDINMFDAVRVVHPKTTEALTALMTGKYKPAKTWEVLMSRAGKTEDVVSAKADAWKSLLLENKLGYLALLRNLRNIAQTGDNEIINLACAALINADVIRNAKIFPYQFYSAYNELSYECGTSLMLSALEKAAEISLENIPDLEGASCVCIDHSSSMTSKLSNRSVMSPIIVGTILGASLAKKFSDSDVILFTTKARYASIDKNAGLLSITDSLMKGTIPEGTSYAGAFRIMKKKYSRIIFVTDGQVWQGNTDEALKVYKSNYNADPYIYDMVVQEYGTTVFKNRKHINLAGFSDKVFKFFETAEKDPQVMITEIEKIQL